MLKEDPQETGEKPGLACNLQHAFLLQNYLGAKTLQNI